MRQKTDEVTEKKQSKTAIDWSKSVKLPKNIIHRYIIFR